MVRILFFNRYDRNYSEHLLFDKRRKWCFNESSVLFGRFQSLLSKWIHLCRQTLLQILCTSCHFCNAGIQRIIDILTTRFRNHCSSNDIHRRTCQWIHTAQRSHEWASSLCRHSRSRRALVRTNIISRHHLTLHLNLRSRKRPMDSLSQVWTQLCI